MRTITVAQIGYGYWGPKLLAAFARAPGVRVRWVCDLSRSRRKEADAHHPGVKTTRRIHDVLDDPAVDVVVVATEPASHYEHARAALIMGKHTFVEKPLALAADTANLLLVEAEKNRLTLGVGHVYMHHPAVEHIDAELGVGLLGRLQYVDATMANPGPPDPRHSVLWDLAPHWVAAASMLARSQAVAVSARWLDPRRRAAEATVQFLSGVTARVHASWISPARVRRFDAYCDRGTAMLDETASEQLRVVRAGGRDNRSGARGGVLTYGEASVEVPPLPPWSPLDAEVQDFVAAVRARRQPRSSGAVGLEVARVLEYAHISADNDGRELSLIST